MSEQSGVLPGCLHPSWGRGRPKGQVGGWRRGRRTAGEADSPENFTFFWWTSLKGSLPVGRYFHQEEHRRRSHQGCPQSDYCSEAGGCSSASWRRRTARQRGRRPARPGLWSERQHLEVLFKTKAEIASRYSFPHLDSPWESSHGVLVERMADGEVALHGERQDGQNWGIAWNYCVYESPT